MRRHLHHIVFVISLLSLPGLSFAQDAMHIWDANVSSFTDRTPVITSALLELSTPSDHLNPDFGIAPYMAPNADCSEIISRRTSDSRYFVNNQDTNEFYIQTSGGEINYYNDAGQMVSYDPRLQPVGDGIYAALHQKTPTKIDAVNKLTSILLPDGHAFQFNRNLHLKHIAADSSVTDLGPADWTHYSVGDDGIRIMEAWPGIDILITVQFSEIESSFIVKHALPGFTDGYLAIDDNLVIPAGYTVSNGIGDYSPYGWNGSIFIKPVDTGAYSFTIMRGIAFDSLSVSDPLESSSRRSPLGYHYNNASDLLTTLLPVSWLNDTSRVFPVTIDPVVSASTTYGPVMKFGYNGTFCAGSIANDCSYPISCALPVNCTLTAASFSSVYKTKAGSCVFVCYLEEAGFQIDGPCGGLISPGAGFWWSCGPPTGAAIGTCTAVSLDMSALIACETPVCSGNITFTVRTSYCYCASGGDCVGTPCTTMQANSFVITLTGHNLETLGNTATGNGSSTVTSSCCVPVTLDPGPQYGVPPYTYLWSTGATTTTISVFSCANSAIWGPFIWTCIVTDACGVARTATFTLVVSDCGILAIELLNFSGVFDSRNVDLSWQTASEQDNSFFTIEKSIDGHTFLPIATIQGAGTSSVEHNYSAIDPNPVAGINYYRLKSTNSLGIGAYSNIISVNAAGDASFSVYPNPASTSITIESKGEQGEATIVLSDVVGKTLYEDKWNLDDKKVIDISPFRDGLYEILIETGDGIYHKKFIVLK